MNSTKAMAQVRGQVKPEGKDPARRLGAVLRLRPKPEEPAAAPVKTRHERLYGVK